MAGDNPDKVYALFFALFPFPFGLGKTLTNNYPGYM